MKDLNILIAGVGGQGVLLTGRIIAEAALDSSFDVKQSEVHGMAQRGGSVVSHVRIGERIWSPVIAEGECGLIIGFEPVEALRNIHFLSDAGRLVCNTRETSTLTTSTGMEDYPSDIPAAIRSRVPNAVLIDGTSLAVRAGDARALNLALLGAASGFLPFSGERIEAAIKKVLPAKIHNLNIEAFRMGSMATATGKDS